MIFILVYLVAAPLTFHILRKLTAKRSRFFRFAVISVNGILTLTTLFFALRVAMKPADTATPRGINNVMMMNLSIIMVVLPSMLLIVLHYTGVIVKIKHKGYMRSLTGLSVLTWVLIIILCLWGLFIGRFNTAWENVEIKIAGLHHDLDGLVIVHLSDMHLGSFYRHNNKMVAIAMKVNEIKPDIIVNTGDFITLGYAEFGRFDTILADMKSEYGNFAILGNHDMGTYLPCNDQYNAMNTMWLVSDMITASGYTLLNLSNKIINIGHASVAIIGAETRGKHPDLFHPDIDSALKGTDKADLRILLTHDPNHWYEVTDKYPDIELTLAGHTHGMQAGYIGRKKEWSPAKYSYPRWHGLFRVDGMQLYVNRGLGTIGLPIRIGMPPEVTIITLRSE